MRADGSLAGGAEVGARLAGVESMGEIHRPTHDGQNEVNSLLVHGVKIIGSATHHSNHGHAGGPGAARHAERCLAARRLAVHHSLAGYHYIAVAQRLIEPGAIKHRINPRRERAPKREHRRTQTARCTRSGYTGQRTEARGSHRATRRIEQRPVADHPAVVSIERVGILGQPLLRAKNAQGASRSHQRIRHIRKRDKARGSERLHRRRQIDRSDLLKSRETRWNVPTVRIEQPRAERLQKSRTTVVGRAPSEAEIDDLRAGRNRVEHQLTHAVGRGRERSLGSSVRATEARDDRHLDERFMGSADGALGAVPALLVCCGEYVARFC